MIPLKIRNLKYKIKAIDELTTAEFISLSKIENPDLIKYISWQLNIPLDKAFQAVIDPLLITAIGTMPDITKMPKPKGFDYSKIIQTVGQRFQVEESGLSGFDLLVFVLAVSQAQSMNIDEVYKLRDSYLVKPFKETLPAGFFFFKTLQNGKPSARNFLRKLQALINTALKRNRRELKS